ncbi:hypothetical protein NM688_g5832 [Phlebia brevispora]|uniref:Uncharacterized protein n=1 Tax=Phlebia brevispora TaxID=194682 RepID=A0ACC1SP09_9APHY|nr:hypothetical protein NM688_g5832 [Phlebia brevispora]
MEKRVAEEARIDQKNLDHALRDLKKAEKTHQSATNDTNKAQQSVDKAVQNEYKEATALNKAQHQHETSVTEQQTADKTLDLRREHEARLEQDLQQRRSTFDDLQHRKDVNDASYPPDALNPNRDTERC